MKKLLLSILLGIAFIALIRVPVDAQVSVTATSGTLSASYSTLKASFDAINVGIHKGVITISLTASTTETATATLNASGSGICSYSSILISPSGGGARTISGSLAGSLINLNGADNVTIDGLNCVGNSLTIENQGTATNSVTLVMTNSATSNLLTRLTLLGSTAANATYGVLTFYNGTNSNNSVTYCNIGPSGSNKPWACIMASGGSNNNMTIDHCNLYDFYASNGYQAGIYLKTANSSGWTITNNNIYQTSSVIATNGTVNGIYIGSGNGYTISTNYFGGSAPFCAGNPMTYTGTLYSMSFIETAKASNGLSNAVVNTITNNTISNINISSGNTTAMGYLWESRFSAFKLQGGKHSIKYNTIGSLSANADIALDNGSYASPYSIVLLNGVPSAWSSTGLILESFSHNTVAGLTINSLNTNFFSFIKAEINNTGDILRIDSICNNTFGSSLPGSISIPNSIISGYYYGLYFQSGSNSSPTVFSGNTFQEFSMGAGPMTVALSMQMMDFTDNIIKNISTAGNSVKGIYYSYSTSPTTISGNYVVNLSSSMSSSIYGIYTDNNATNSIFNNIVSLGEDSPLNNAYYGIYIYYGSSVYFNTVYIGGSGTSGNSSSYAFYCSLNGYTRNIRDNAFNNSRNNAGGTGSHYAIFLPGTTSLTINYNNYFAPNSGGVLGYLGGNKNTLTEWQNATGQDALSLNLDPVFDEPGGVLASDYLPSGNMLGTSIDPITTDYGGVTRSSTPTMGSFEPAKIWNGSVSTAWSNDANWTPAGVPTEGASISIQDAVYDPILDQVRTVGNLSIDQNAVLTIPAGTGLTVNGELVNNGDGSNLQINSGAGGSGSLISATSGVSANDQVYIPGNEWHLISSPILDGYSGIFLSMYLQSHDESTNAYTDITATNVALTPGKGLALFSASNQLITFSGKLNSGTIGAENNLSHSDAGWNLVGNPYPSSIDWDAATGWTKTNVRSATYIHVNASTWATYVGGVGTNGGSRYIAPGQGFFVQVNNAGPGSLIMNDEVRVHENSTFFKKGSESVSDLVRLKVEGNSGYDDMVLRILPQSTTNYDADYDALKLFGDEMDIPQIYTSTGDDDLSISTLPAAQTTSVGVKCNASGNYTLSVAEIHDFNELTLEDTKTGAYHNLLGGAYSFMYEAGEVQPRFNLHFKTLGESDPQSSGISVYAVRKTIVVNMKSNTKGNISVYSLSGSQIASQPANTEITKIDVRSGGIYLVKVVLGNDILVRKLVIEQ